MTKPIKDFSMVTTQALNGTGLFDVLMGAVKQHLAEEYSQQRIRGTDYSKVYLGSMEAVLGNTIQYLVPMQLIEEQRLKLLAETKLVEAQLAKTAVETQLVDAELQKTRYEIEFLLPLQKEQLALANRKVDSEIRLTDAQVAKLQYEIQFLLPLQKEQLLLANRKVDADILYVGVQAARLQYEIDYLLPLQQQQLQYANRKLDMEIRLADATLRKMELGDIPLILAQIKGVDATTSKTQTETVVAEWTGKTLEYKYRYGLPAEVEKLIAEANLVRQKYRSEIAQISDVVEGVSIGGVIRANIQLLEQQRLGFIRDAEQKAAKIYVDSWSVRKSVDEGTLVPGGLQDGNIQQVLAKLQAGVGA